MSRNTPAMSTTDTLLSDLEAALTARGWRVETRPGDAFVSERLTFYNPDGRLMIEGARKPFHADEASLSGVRNGTAWHADLNAGTSSRAAIAAVDAALTDGPPVDEALQAAGWRVKDTKHRGHLVKRVWHSPDGTREVSLNCALPRNQVWKVRHDRNREDWYPTGDHDTPPAVITALALTAPTGANPKD